MRVRLPDHIMLAGVGEEAVLLNTRTEQFHGLNGTATRMLSVLQEVGDVASAKDRLVTEFDAAPERISVDLDRLIEGLFARGLLERVGDG